MLSVAGNPRISGGSAIRSLMGTERRTHFGLRELNFSGCNIGEGVVALAEELLKDPRCRLEKLDLSYTQLHDHTLARAFGRGVGQNRSLIELTLQHCYLKDSLTSFVGGIDPPSPHEFRLHNRGHSTTRPYHQEETATTINSWDIGRNALSRKALRSFCGFLVRRFGEGLIGVSSSSSGSTTKKNGEQSSSSAASEAFRDAELPKLLFLGLSETPLDSAEDAFVGHALTLCRLSRAFSLDLTRARIKLCQRDVTSRAANHTTPLVGGGGFPTSSGGAGSERSGGSGRGPSTSNGTAGGGGSSSSSVGGTGTHTLTLLESLAKITLGSLTLDGTFLCCNKSETSPPWSGSMSHGRRWGGRREEGGVFHESRRRSP